MPLRKPLYQDETGDYQEMANTDYLPGRQPFLIHQPAVGDKFPIAEAVGRTLLSATHLIIGSGGAVTWVLEKGAESSSSPTVILSATNTSAETKTTTSIPALNATVADNQVWWLRITAVTPTVTLLSVTVNW